MVQRLLILLVIVPMFAACGRKGITVPAVIVGALKGTPTPSSSPSAAPIPNPLSTTTPTPAPTLAPATPPPQNAPTTAALTGSLTASSTTLAFGNVQIGQSAQLSVSFTNNHNLPVLLHLVSTFNTSAFTVVSQNCEGVSLPTGGQCTVTVRFQPSAQVCNQFQVYLSYTAANSGTLYSPIVEVTGCGTPATPTLSGSVTLAASTMNFGNVRVGQSTYTTGFWFQNNHNVAINGVRILGLTTSPYFAYLNSDGCTNTTIQPGGVCPFSVTFRPGFTGLYEQEIRLRYTPVGFDVRESAAIAVSGCGVDDNQLNCNLTYVTGLTGSVTSAASTLNFGNVSVGNAVYSTGFWFQNNHNMTINNIRILGLSTSPYILYLNSDGCTNTTLQPGQSCYFSITFQPQFAGSYQQLVRLRYSPISFNPRHSDPITVGGKGI